jgi:aspartyl-tRNA(Asn)/glutamyl-tRNA(Gln) amidotransferase subunit B
MRWKPGYHFEPDLVPLCIDGVDRARASGLARTPYTRRRFTHYGLPDYDAEVLTASKALADYYKPVRLYNPPPGGGN